MTNSYRVIQDGKLFCVKEIKTEQILSTHKSHREAKHIVNTYNGGQGFNGWTPTFMTRKVADI